VHVHFFSSMHEYSVCISEMIGLTIFYLQTWVLGKPLSVVLDVPDYLDHPTPDLVILVYSRLKFQLDPHMQSFNFF
jgi:hypothetical protein